MAKKIDVFLSRTIKLSNAVCREVYLSDNESPINIEVERMDNFIKSKGSKPFGPVIQLNKSFVNEDGELDFKIILIRQSQNYINHVELPYSIESVLKEKDCLYTRFQGREEDIKFAYNKLAVFAYEEGIKLTGTSYTVFVDRFDEDVIIDIFMSKEQQ